MILWHPWHAKSVDEAFELLESKREGLTPAEAARRLAEQGLNKLPESKADSLALIFLRQFQSPLIYLLLVAAAAVFTLGERADGIIILAVLLFNALVGTIQEGRAQKTLHALKNFVTTNATVVRANEELIIPDTEVVPGDVIILQEGEKIPADARVIASRNLTLDEAALTGESIPVHKVIDVLPDAGNGSRHNLLYKGTHITVGNGTALVVKTGLDTAIGAIAKEVSKRDTEIPLKADIRRLSHLIIRVVALLCVTLFTFGLATGRGFVEMFATVVSLAVSVIPEGLPIVMTLVLATGVWRMSKRNALVKKLQAVEALGQASVIAVDKTGTITKNELVVQKIFVTGKIYNVSGVGYDPAGEITPAPGPALALLGKIAALCSVARLMYAEEAHEWRISGEPTEAAILVASRKLGIEQGNPIRALPLIAEIPFDYHLKYRATLHEEEGRRFLSVIGAPETILALSTENEAARARLEAEFLRLSRMGLRVVALAYRTVSASFELHSPDDVADLVFAGFFGMKDGLRPEVAGAIEEARAAGLHIVMVTGDHRATASAVAREAGIYREGDEILTGLELDTLSVEELSARLGRVSVFARVTPAHKLRIIAAYRACGEVVAMTGDGVNDAPSLVAADLGVAMGEIGTEVAKEAADIVLLDDNFRSIIAAIEEGRSIYKTVKKVILYLFSTGVGEALAIIGALATGVPLLLLPAQIIWLNFVTDGFLDVALAMEPKEKGLLSGRFGQSTRSLVDRLMLRRIAFMATPMAVGALVLFTLFYESDLGKALTLSVTTLAIFQWFNAWNCRSETRSIFAMNPFSNPFLVGATGMVIALQLLAVYHPFFQGVLHTVPLSLSEWGLAVGVAASIIVVEEVRKFVVRYTEGIKREIA